MCWYCGSPITNPEPIGRSAVCPDCGKDLRSCCNCRHYLKAEKNCAEPQGENPTEKDRANFCDWFGLNSKFRNASGGEKNDVQGEAKAAFNNLFK
jgi:predicted amidophosphoribosyltransferase